jgi:hypothetical protein
MKWLQQQTKIEVEIEELTKVKTPLVEFGAWMLEEVQGTWMREEECQNC